MMPKSDITSRTFVIKKQSRAAEAKLLDFLFPE